MSFEFTILDCIQKYRSPIVDIILNIFSTAGDYGIIWILLAFILLINPKTRKLGIVLSISLIIDFIICNATIKPLVARIRPFDINKDIILYIKKPHDYSFPSGHTAASFAFVLPLIILVSKKYWIPFLVIATLISFSRIYFYVHYPTDVLGGIIIGILSGLISCYICKKFFKISKETCF